MDTARFVAFIIILPRLCLSLAAPAPSQDSQRPKIPEEKTPRIVEEILVIGKRPSDTQVSTVSRIEATSLDEHKPLDLSEAIKYAPGVYVTVGEKNEFNLKLRGMDSRRIALFVDGVPSYEPYFSTFDLKTVEVSSADSIQVTRGPASVLYGPNTLGGIVNVITRRPEPKPSLSIAARYGENRTRSLGLNASSSWRKFSWTGNWLYQDSAGFSYSDGTARVRRANSEYERLSANAKIYYSPNSQTEILLGGSLYHSAYGLPASTTAVRPRYWRFKNWDRNMVHAGGFTSLGGRSVLRFRGYWVNYYNTLDQFKDAAMTSRQFESSFDNSAYGLFTLADLPTGQTNTIKASVTLQEETVRTQDDTGLPWQRFREGFISTAVEDHIALTSQWTLVFGASLDDLHKFKGNNATKLNPLLGAKFSPWRDFEAHLSFSRKSRFPSMRSLYSTSSGNPNLLSESGKLWELGASWTGAVNLSGAVFFNDFKDMIESLRLPDGTRKYYNINRAYINGAEVQVQKSSRQAAVTVNYTYLDHRNQTENRPLDALPRHTLNFEGFVRPLLNVRLSLFGLYASRSEWYDFSAGRRLPIPSYFDLDTVLSYSWARLELFLKLGNIFNEAYFTEPGFPCPGRTLEIGVRADVFGK